MPSNTAERWWVRVGARWVARIESVQGQLQLAFQAMTGVSLASGALKYFGLASVVPFFLGATAAGVLAYAYLYSEGGVWNQTARDRVDLSDNYSGPTMLMDARIEARQFAYLAHALQNGGADDPEALYEQFRDITDEEWAAMRDGVDLAEVTNA